MSGLDKIEELVDKCNALAAHVEDWRKGIALAKAWHWERDERGYAGSKKEADAFLDWLADRDQNDSPTTSLARRDAQMKAEAFVEAGAACMHIEKGQNSLAWLRKEVAPDGEEYVGENGIPYSNKALGAQHCKDEMARLQCRYRRQAAGEKS